MKENKIVTVVFLLLGLGAFAVFSPTDSSDLDRWNRSGAKLIIDYETGCEYLGSFSGLTPRLGVDGKHICRSH